MEEHSRTRNSISKVMAKWECLGVWEMQPVWKGEVNTWGQMVLVLNATVRNLKEWVWREGERQGEVTLHLCFREIATWDYVRIDCLPTFHYQEIPFINLPHRSHSLISAL